MDETTEKNSPRDNAVKVIHKAFSILKYMASERRTLKITEIAAATEIPKGTVYRILDSLVAEGMVLPREKEFELGPTTVFLAAGYRGQAQLAEVARPFLVKLRNELLETVHLLILENWELFYLDKMESPYQVRMHSRVGGKGNPLRLSAGRAILAILPPEEQSFLLGTAPTSELQHECEDIRKVGYAIDNEDNEPGLRCVGAAITDDEGFPLGAISISAPIYRFTEEKIPLFGKVVAQIATEISNAWKDRYKQEEKSDPA